MTDPKPHNNREHQRQYNAAADQAIAAYLAGGQRTLLLRLTVQLLAWIVLARAIVLFDLNWFLVLLPLILEFQLLIWLGPPLATFVIDEPVFRSKSGRWLPALLWSFLLLIPPALLLLSQFQFHWAPLKQFLSASWLVAWSTGVALACLLVVVNMLVDTAHDIRQWRTVGGAFVWPATLRIGMRFITLFVIGLLIAFAIAGISTVYDLLGQRLDWFDHASSRAWLAWTVVVLSDIGEYLLASLLLRKTEPGHAQPED